MSLGRIELRGSRRLKILFIEKRFSTTIFSLTLSSTFLAGLTAAASLAYLHSLRKLLAGRDAERLLVDDESADQQRGGDEDEGRMSAWE